MTGSTAPVAVAGAGLAGSLAAIYLARRGLDVTVYERRPDMRTAQIAAGRSINLALSVRGLTALAGVGLDQDVLAMAIPMRGRMMHAVDGTLRFQPYGRDEEAIYSVSRRELNVMLMDRAEASGVRFQFNTRVRDVDVRDGTLTLQTEGATETTRQPSQFVIGADGAFSQIRQRMQRRGRFNFSQAWLAHGYKELTIPPAEDGSFRLEPEALHIWPRRDFMLIALPNPDRSFTCTLFLAHEGAQDSFEALSTPEAVTAFFNAEFADAVPHLEALTDTFFANPTGNLVTIRCSPYNHGERALLIGDAAHAIVPFYGQGMNAAFEDCTVLEGLMDTHGIDDIGRVFHAFSDQRAPDADAIAELAVYNFEVMRALVADEKFLQRKALEHILEEEFGDTYRSLYGMVTFSNIPYAEALQRARDQSAWLDSVGASGGAEIAGLLALAWVRRFAR